MSLQPSSPAEVPSQTAAVARAAFPWGNAYMRLRDELGTVFTDAQFTAVFSSRGRPAEAPWQLARVAVLQFAENLSDRRAAEVARGRIDWKYLLSLDLTDPGSSAPASWPATPRRSCSTRSSALCREHRFLVARGRRRTDSTHVLGAVRSLTRLGCVTETLRAALYALAGTAPEWLRAHAEESWSERDAKPTPRDLRRKSPTPDHSRGDHVGPGCRPRRTRIDPCRPGSPRSSPRHAPGRCRLRRCGPVARQDTRSRRDAARAEPPGYAVAVASVGSLRASGLPDRLGSQDRHLSGRSHDDELEPGSQPGSHSDAHPLLQCGLQALRARAELYALPAPVAHAASARGARRAEGRASARGRRGLCRAVPLAGGHRRDAVAGRADPASSMGPLSWAGQGPSPACADRGRPQHRPDRRLAGR
ncbi:hypothetical protein MPEAHAMD_4211 [Methylobacterium frigidaeris]|uniref:Transposase InsH N-terminal domain-containing protein n=1 Tax=Methylobacterium frigidaeris TaxID=2038277 RepID=A0AA37HDY1_9HYPH|nr:hypothetical protein MPEAHAMD_4211 [Methylobacterium frigidaeris]